MSRKTRQRKITVPPPPPDCQPFCESCAGFLGWHPDSCRVCRAHLEQYHPDAVMAAYGYDPRAGQTWQDRVR